MQVKPAHVLLSLALAAAGGVGYLATRTVGPLPMPAFTEEHDGGRGCMHFPRMVAPNLAYAVTHGFAPSGEPLDPQAADMPAEEMW